MGISLIGASQSEPHTSKLNGAILIYMYIYIIYYISVIHRSVKGSGHSFNLKHYIRRVQVWTEYRKEHVAKVNCVNKGRILVYGVLLLHSFTFSVFAYMEQS